MGINIYLDLTVMQVEGDWPNKVERFRVLYHDYFLNFTEMLGVELIIVL